MASIVIFVQYRFATFGREVEEICKCEVLVCFDAERERGGGFDERTLPCALAIILARVLSLSLALSLSHLLRTLSDTPEGLFAGKNHYSRQRGRAFHRDEVPGMQVEFVFCPSYPNFPLPSASPSSLR